MFQVRFHGRGGQGVVTAAELLAALIIQDPTLLHQAELFAGLSPAGYMLINSTHGFGELGLDEFVTGFHRDRLLVVPSISANPASWAWRTRSRSSKSTVGSSPSGWMDS
jgi:hypothetical protein